MPTPRVLGCSIAASVPSLSSSSRRSVTSSSRRRLLLFFPKHISRFEQRKGRGDGDGLGRRSACRWEASPKGRGYHAAARLIHKYSGGSLTYQPSKHQLAT